MPLGPEIQLLGGPVAQLPALDDREPYWATDTHVLYIGQGGVNYVVGAALAAPLTVPQGGTGDATLTNHGVLLGQGTAAVVVTAALADGQLLVGQTGADPLPKTLSGSGATVTLSAAGVLTISAIAGASLANAGVTLAKIANAAANSKLVGSGAAGSGSSYSEIALGTNLSMSGTTLNAAGMTVGSAVSGGSANHVLCVDGSGNLANGFGYDGAQATVVGTVAGVTYSASVGGTGAGAGYFGDGTHTAFICDGTYSINIDVGLINVQGTSGNTYRWNAGTAAPTPQTLLTLPLNVYGQGTITDLLGDPDAWVLVNKAGTDYKIPLYLP